MTVLRVAGFLLGLALAIWPPVSAVRTVLLPRGARSFLTAFVFRSVGGVLRVFANRASSFTTADRIMSLWAPVGLLSIVASWLSLLLVGFTLIFWAVGEGTLGDGFHLSGSSITTLGFAPAGRFIEQLLAFIAAGLGLFLLALLITFLPTLYSAFSRRERKVALLEVRAGSPPSALEFLLRYKRIGWLDRLETEWIDWEEWFVDLEETHVSYGALSFFRSPQPDRSWVTAAGTVLDTAALYASALRGFNRAPAGICIRSGYVALRRIASLFGIEYDLDPKPDDPITITRPEFDQVYDALTEEGLPLVADREQAWKDYAGWRVNYDAALLSLAELTMAPYAPWTSDRSAPNYRRPRLSRMFTKNGR